MEDPGMFPVPDISSDGAPGECYRSQVGEEALDPSKWGPRVLLSWRSFSLPPFGCRSCKGVVSRVS